jgi:hypothetical protein
LQKSSDKTNIDVTADTVGGALEMQRKSPAVVLGEDVKCDMTESGRDVIDDQSSISQEK